MERGLLGPSSKRALGTWTDGPIEGRQQQRRADRQSPGSLGHVSIDDLHHSKPIRRSLQRRDIAMLEGAYPQLPLGSLQQPVQQLIGAAQVQQRHGARTAPHAARFDDPPVGASGDPVLLQAGHWFCVYQNQNSRSTTY